MTIEEIARQVTVGIGVVVVVFCAGFIVVILLGLVFELAGWISQRGAFRALQCRRRGHGWFSVSAGQIDKPESYTRHRVCGHCGRREELRPIPR